MKHRSSLKMKNRSSSWAISNNQVEVNKEKIRNEYVSDVFGGCSVAMVTWVQCRASTVIVGWSLEGVDDVTVSNCRQVIFIWERTLETRGVQLWQNDLRREWQRKWTLVHRVTPGKLISAPLIFWKPSNPKGKTKNEIVLNMRKHKTKLKSINVDHPG